MRSLWKLIIITTLVQVVQCKKYIGKHFLISTKHGTSMHRHSKLDLNTKKFFDKKHGLHKKINSKLAVKAGHDYQVSGTNSPFSIIPPSSTGKYNTICKLCIKDKQKIYRKKLFWTNLSSPSTCYLLHLVIFLVWIEV